MLVTAGVCVCRCRCMRCIKGLQSVQVHLSCASVVCVISLAGCVCNFTIKADAVFFCFFFFIIIVCTVLINIIELSLHWTSCYWNYLRAFEAGICAFWGIYRVLWVLNTDSDAAVRQVAG